LVVGAVAAKEYATIADKEVKPHFSQIPFPSFELVL
jgi:hypothetical protein